MLESDNQDSTVDTVVYAVFKSLAFWDPHITRKLSYRKDGRAMRLRPIYGALKIFESPCMSMPTAILLPKFLMGFVAIYPVTTKFEVCSFTRS